MNSIDYKQKYLKYKQKYLYLKNVQQGGATLTAYAMTHGPAKAKAEAEAKAKAAAEAEAAAEVEKIQAEAAAEAAAKKIHAELELLVAKTVLPYKLDTEWWKAAANTVPILISRDQIITFPDGNTERVGGIPTNAISGDIVWIIDTHNQYTYYIENNETVEVKIKETWNPNTNEKVTFPNGSIMFIRLPSNIESGQIIRVKPSFNPYSSDITKGIGTVLS